MAEDLSREAIEQRRRQEEQAAAASAVQQATEMPLQVLYANEVTPSVQADGSVCLRFEYHGAGGTVPVAELVLPAAAFARGLAGPGHAVVAQAAEQQAAAAAMLVGAVAKRAAMTGGGPAGGNAAAQARRQVAGD